MKKEGIKVTAIEITQGQGDHVKLTVEEAKELYEQLKTLFGEKETIIYRDHYYDHYRPYPYWQPMWSTTGGGTLGAVTCGGTSKATGMTVAYSGTKVA